MIETALMNKKQLGQFFTVNSDYILSGLSRFIKNKEVADPFAGRGDLLDWAEKHGAKCIKGFDVDKNYVDGKRILFNDSIKNPKKYRFVITNPPYLNINKAGRPIKEKYFKNSEFEDLYQISLRAIMDSEEGIVIVPINFLSAENSRKICNVFFSKFEIKKMNYFKEQVFPDTTYNVIAFYYKKKKNILNSKFTIKTNIFPDKQHIALTLYKQYDWAIGGDILNHIKNYDNFLGIHRLVETDIKPGRIKLNAAYNHINDQKIFSISENMVNKIKSSIIFLKAIDSGSEDGKIGLEDLRKYKVDALVSKESSRHMIQLLFSKPISISDQEKIIQLFNEEINKLRNNHLSLFLTNYRDNDRKRISFDFVYKFINYLYDNYIGQHCSPVNSLF